MKKEEDIKGEKKEVSLCKNCTHSYKYGSGMCMNSGENERIECMVYKKKGEAEDKKWEQMGELIRVATQSIVAPMVETRTKKLEGELEHIIRGKEKKEKKEVYQGMGLFNRKKSSKKCPPHEWVITKKAYKKYMSDYYPFDEEEKLLDVERICVLCKLVECNEHTKYRTSEKNHHLRWESGQLSEYTIKDIKDSTYEGIHEVCTYEHALGLDRPTNEINFCANCGMNIAGLTKCNKCGFEYELV